MLKPAPNRAKNGPLRRSDAWQIFNQAKRSVLKNTKGIRRLRACFAKCSICFNHRLHPEWNSCKIFRCQDILVCDILRLGKAQLQPPWEVLPPKTWIPIALRIDDRSLAHADPLTSEYRDGAIWHESELASSLISAARSVAYVQQEISLRTMCTIDATLLYGGFSWRQS